MNTITNPTRGGLRIIRPFITCLLAIGAASSAFSQLSIYAVRKEQAYRQTGDNTINPYYYRFDAQLRTQNENDFDYVTLDGATGGQIALTESGKYWTYTSQTFGDMGSMDAAYPDTTYTFTAGGGILSEPLELTVDLATEFPATQPMLTGTSFSDLNAWSPEQGDLMITFDGHIDIPEITYVKTYVTFYNKTTNDGVPISWSLDSTDTSLLLDGTLFQSGHEYYGYLQYFHQYSDEDHENFGSLKVRTTSFSFTTGNEVPPPAPVPEPATYGLLGAAALLMVTVAKRRRSTRGA